VVLVDEASEHPVSPDAVERNRLGNSADGFQGVQIDATVWTTAPATLCA
jgi:hypothetical protein